MPSVFRDARSVWERAPRPPSRLQSRLVAAAVLVCGVGAALAAGLPRGHSVFQAGPVADAHAPFQDDCRRCHDGPFQTARRLLPGDGSARSVSDAACQGCHDSGPHYAAAAPAPGCAVCHREHRGRANLARVGDRLCLNCHADLKNHSERGAAKFADVVGFPDGHPPFARRTDPGQLHFSHASHLQSQGIPRPDGTVQRLDCAACHAADGDGRYMRPVKYAEHCATCHPLSVQLAGRGAGAEAAAALAGFAKEPAPHRAPAEIRTALGERLQTFVREHPLTAKAAEDMPLRLSPLPTAAFTASAWRPAEAPLTDGEQRTFIAGQRVHLEGLLFDRAGGCQLCHVRGKESRAAPDGLPEFEPTRLPNRWQPGSHFRHAAHRLMACAECHPAAGSQTTRDVLIPTLDVCVRCHNPNAAVRHDCAECHAYHHGAP